MCCSAAPAARGVLAENTRRPAEYAVTTRPQNVELLRSFFPRHWGSEFRFSIFDFRNDLKKRTTRSEIRFSRRVPSYWKRATIWGQDASAQGWTCAELGH